MSAWSRHLGARCKAARTAAQSLNSAATTTILLTGTDVYDQFDMHYTSDVALTGTVAKTAASDVLTGTGTAFTSELAVGQIIAVPGTATERRVVTEIASDTSLTVSGDFANSASGQTAARYSGGIVVRDYMASGTPRIAIATAYVLWAVNTTGARRVYPTPIRAGVDIDSEIVQYGNNGTGIPGLATTRQFAVEPWDWIELRARQDSGGALNADSASLAVLIL